MDKKSKILIGVFVVLILASVGATYWRIMVKKDYIIEAQTDCDPYVDVCFVWECDPESTVEGEVCTENPEDNIWYFQVIRRKAFKIPLCDPSDENCTALTCPEGEADCEYEFCTAENMEDQYAAACNDPVKFTQENPIEEEACDPETDEECVPEEEVACDPEGEEECSAAEEGAETPTEGANAEEAAE